MSIHLDLDEITSNRYDSVPFFPPLLLTMQQSASSKMEMEWLLPARSLALILVRPFWGLICIVRFSYHPMDPELVNSQGEPRSGYLGCQRSRRKSQQETSSARHMRNLTKLHHMESSAVQIASD
jgi:hypothetical protein